MANRSATDPELYDQFARMVEVIDAAGIPLEVMPAFWWPEGMHGLYKPPPQGPRIYLVREGALEEWCLECIVAGIENCRFELITLAHEHGHHLSHTAGTATPEYYKLVDDWNAGKPLGIHETEMIVLEERRAWDFARATLGLLGFREWPAFNMRWANAITAYRQYLASGRRIGESLD